MSPMFFRHCSTAIDAQITAPMIPLIPPRILRRGAPARRRHMQKETIFSCTYNGQLSRQYSQCYRQYSLQLVPHIRPPHTHSSLYQTQKRQKPFVPKSHSTQRHIQPRSLGSLFRRDMDRRRTSETRLSSSSSSLPRPLLPSPS